MCIVVSPCLPNRRVHDSLNNLTPVDVYHGRAREIITAGNLVKEQTMRRGRRHNLGLMPLNEEIIRPAVYRESVHQQKTKLVSFALTTHTCCRPAHALSA